MSYRRRVTETIVICNDDEKIKKVVHGVKEYLRDIFNNVKIESLDGFELDLRCDELILKLGLPDDSFQGEELEFDLKSKDPDKIIHIIQDLEFYRDLNIEMSYSGDFFYGHPYGVDRMASLLEGSYNHKVKYLANEYLDSEHHIYQYDESEGNIISGVIAPVETPLPFQKKLWNVDVCNVYFCFSSTVNEKEVKEILSLESELRNTFGLELERKQHSKLIEFEIHDLGMFYRLTYEELMVLKEYLQKIVTTAPEKVKAVNLNLIFEMSGEKDSFREIMITHEGEGVVLGYYGPESKKVRPYHSKISQLYQTFENIFGKREDRLVDYLTPNIKNDEVLVDENNKPYCSNRIGMVDFKDIIFVLTDCNYRKEVAQFILKKQGIIKDTINKKSQVLIFNSIETVKYKKALELKESGWNIQLITEADFMEEYGIEPIINQYSGKTEKQAVIEGLVNLYEIQGGENLGIPKVHFEYYMGHLHSEILSYLQEQKLILLSKGIIEILDPEALRSRMINHQGED
ncbi:hypothetical protein [Proteiniclasticum ruminis]|uniref:BRCT domain-containing protein n=1 Tax=Proteiniclasticum ruminis TaxID=398199 RepID=A0A1I5AFS8_9CLOT|nr:hypothetical protein [Proteiniclasticum ruminis]SFN61252.1 hypothetical protein SAMN04488695_1032 [Proteiniclasticum ruminis]